MENSRSLRSRDASTSGGAAISPPLPKGLTVIGPETYAMRLSGALAEFGISADVNGGHGLAVVSVWADLTVWCDLQWFWWQTGLNSRTHRPVYACHPVNDVSRAARRVAFSYADLRAADEPHHEEQRSGEPA